MKFSFIVSIYNVEKYLSECIESLLNQSYEDFEVILVDDGSSDNCPQICDNYSKYSEKVRTIHKKNGGLVSTRKVGVSNANGEYICFIDGDDFVDRSLLSSYERIIKEHNPDIICAGHINYYNESKKEDKSNMAENGYYNKEKLKNEIYGRMMYVPPFYTFYIFPSVCTKCFRKNTIIPIYQEISEDISHGEDAALTYAALLKCNSIFVTDYRGYYYRIIMGSMTKGYRKNLYNEIKTLIEYFYSLQDRMNWDAGSQLDMYIYYLISFAISNEFYYNKGSFTNKKKEIEKYFKIEGVFDSVRKAKLDSFNERIKQFCFLNRIYFPLYFYYILKK